MEEPTSSPVVETREPTADSQRTEGNANQTVVLKTVPASNEQNRVAATKRPRAKRHAILYGYLGTSFSGNTFQPAKTGVRTVDGELIRALVEIGALHPKDAERPAESVKWATCARTDRGVHAAANVVCAYLSISLSSAGEKNEDDDLEIVARLNAVLTPDVRVLGVRRVNNVFDAHHSADSRAYGYILPSIALFRRGNETSEEKLEIVEDFRAALALYAGTHYFHNFTTEAKAHDPRAQRHIRSIDCTSLIPATEKVPEHLKISIHGSSFMMNQIRRMIAMALFDFAVSTDPNFPGPASKSDLIQCAFRRDVTVKGAPMVPAEGLFLEYTFFKAYNNRLEKDQRSIDFTVEPAASRREALTRDAIVPRVAETVVPAFQKWIETMFNAETFEPNYPIKVELGAGIPAPLLAEAESFLREVEKHIRDAKRARLS